MPGDNLDSDPDFALLAKVDGAIQLVLADLHRTSSQRPSVTVDAFDNGVRITVSNGYGEPSIDSDSGSDAEILLDVAEYLQHRLLEDAGVWPECEKHSVGLHAELIDGAAIWRCRFGEHNAADIGQLGL